ncbi:MAG: FAD-dependent oxidoreductase [Deltaproteobacteria bacterium]|nr:FAD-dependent oxidoreductase [Deltaproteobacteria bacterium]
MKGRSSAPVVVIGAGLTGLSAARHLGRRCVVFEAEDAPGGLARSHRIDGYTFDRTGHWLHLKDKRIRRSLLRLTDWMEVERVSKAFTYDHQTEYPFQVHLHGHRPDILLDCLVGLWKAHDQRRSRRSIHTFEDFIYEHFGEGIARHFLLPYNEKLWGVPAKHMTTDWCQRFFPATPVEQILAGIVGAKLPQMGYNVAFLYPKNGGIGLLAQAMADRLPKGVLSLSSPVERIDYKKKQLMVNGQWTAYSGIISTIPLPELIARLENPPKRVLQAVEKLTWTQVHYLDVATKRPVRQSYHWVYVPERKYPFYRAGVYSNVAPHMAPKGGSSLYVELSSRATPSAATIKDVVAGMKAIGLISSARDVLFAKPQSIEYAYVIYDQNHQTTRRFLLSFLASKGIHSTGRYGSWEYNSMEDSILAGRNAAASYLPNKQ